MIYKSKRERANGVRDTDGMIARAAGAKSAMAQKEQLINAKSDE